MTIADRIEEMKATLESLDWKIDGYEERMLAKEKMLLHEKDE